MRHDQRGAVRVDLEVDVDRAARGGVAHGVVKDGFDDLGELGAPVVGGIAVVARDSQVIPQLGLTLPATLAARGRRERFGS